MIDINMCLPWFKGSDDLWASCFTILPRQQGVVQETFDFKVEGFVEEVGSHLCDLVYERDQYVEVVFCEFWGMRRFDECSIYTFSKGGLDIERSWTRNATRNLYHIRDSSSMWWKFRE